jgi:hypothetical protein
MNGKVQLKAQHMISGETIDDDQCFAPFLDNQWVNMAMYFSYYWSTLVAMLILYAGIHNASQKLQMKGDAREKRTIALLMGQRLGAQVNEQLVIYFHLEQGWTETARTQPIKR